MTTTKISIAGEIKELQQRVGELEKPKVVAGPSVGDLLKGAENSMYMEDFVARCIKQYPPRSHWPLVLTIATFAALALVLTWSIEKSINRLTTAVASKEVVVIVQPAAPAPTAAPVPSPEPQRPATAPALAGKQHPEGHSLELQLSVPCWLRVTELTPGQSVLWEANAPPSLHKEFTFDKATSVEVRNGCPGTVWYRVDGVATVPFNKSGKPRDSEVVDLTL